MNTFNSGDDEREIRTERPLVGNQSERILSADEVELDERRRTVITEKGEVDAHRGDGLVHENLGQPDPNPSAPDGVISKTPI
ncbi:MAG: hypothetical protein ACREM6_11810 [Vulcanimicrobiaceae bacterium]